MLNFSKQIWLEIYLKSGVNLPFFFFKGSNICMVSGNLSSTYLDVDVIFDKIGGTPSENAIFSLKGRQKTAMISEFLGISFGNHPNFRATVPDRSRAPSISV